VTYDYWANWFHAGCIIAVIHVGAVSVVLVGEIVIAMIRATILCSLNQSTGAMCEWFPFWAAPFGVAQGFHGGALNP